jgi:NitT/TauT family transport system permease protein
MAIASSMIAARAEQRASAPRARAAWRVLLWPGAIVVGLLIWELLWRSHRVPAYTLPSPRTVGHEWLRLWNNGVLRHHLFVTLHEATVGFVVALAIGLPVGYAIARFRALDAVLSPYIAASQATPVVALAPLFVVWFGLGLLPKVIICALIVVFPIIITTQTGLRGVERDLIEASWTMGGSRWQTLRYVEAPLALSSVLGGVKMGITLAMTGAVVGEFVAASAGLGYLMNFGRSLYNAPMVFAAALTIAAAAMLGYAAISVLQHILIDWE